MGCSTWAQFWTLKLIIYFFLWTKTTSKYNFFLSERFSVLCFKSSATSRELCKESEHMSCTLPDCPHSWELQKTHNDPRMGRYPGPCALRCWLQLGLSAPLCTVRQNHLICYVKRYWQNHVLFLPNLQQLMWKLGSDVQVYKFPGFTSFQVLQVSFHGLKIFIISAIAVPHRCFTLLWIILYCSPTCLQPFACVLYKNPRTTTTNPL